MLAVTAVKRGHVGLGGATGAVLDRSLVGLRAVIDRSLADVRLSGRPATSSPSASGSPSSSPRSRSPRNSKPIAEGARSRCCRSRAGLAVDADRQMLSSAVANLLQNAFKFGGRTATCG